MELIEQLRAMKALVESPGWAQYVEAVRSQIDLRKGTVLYTPLKALDDALEQEFMKGEIHGQELALSLPSVLIGELEYQIEEKQNESADPSSND